MTNNSTERSLEQHNQFQAQPLTFHSELLEAWKNDRSLLAQLQAPILPPIFESSPSNRGAGVIARDTSRPILARGNDGFELTDHSQDIALDPRQWAINQAKKANEETHHAVEQAGRIGGYAKSTVTNQELQHMEGDANGALILAFNPAEKQIEKINAQLNAIKEQRAKEKETAQ